MPVIRIDFDNSVVSPEEARTLSVAAQKIVHEVTAIDDVMVYANNSEIKINVHPVEVFVYMSAHKIPDVDSLIGAFKLRFAEWKALTGFQHSINLTLTPEPWKIEIGI